MAEEKQKFHRYSEMSDSNGPRLSVIGHNFLIALKHLFWLPLLLAVLFAGIQFLRYQRPHSYTYTCRAVFAVSANYSSSTDILSFNYYYDNAAATQLSATFPYVLSSDAMENLISQKLGTDKIPGKINATSIADAGLFVLTVTSSTPEDAYTVLNAVIDVYPQAATAVLGDTQISIIDEPKIPTESNESYSPVRPLILGTGIGLLLGLGLLFLLCLTRKTVHAAADLRRLINLPCLAYLPHVTLKRRSKKDRNPLNILNERIGSDYLESIRSLRQKLLKKYPDGECKVLLVTSTVASEGKTTTAINLALSLAAEHKRVVLIDADLRKQTMKAALNIQQESEGLLELLTRKSSKFRLLTVPNSSLLVMSGDTTDNHPQRLLDSSRMRQILGTLKSQMDFIILDTPPAGLMSDAATLAKYADGCIYVVRQDTASTSQIYDSIQVLSSADVNLIGCVLNGTKVGTTQNGYGNKYSYGYGYGNRYGSRYATTYATSYSAPADSD